MYQNLMSLDELVEEFLSLPYSGLQKFVDELSLSMPDKLQELWRQPEVVTRVLYFRDYESRTSRDVARYGAKRWN